MVHTVYKITLLEISTFTAKQDSEIEDDETIIIDIETVNNGIENGIQKLKNTIESADTDGDGNFIDSEESVI